MKIILYILLLILPGQIVICQNPEVNYRPVIKLNIKSLADVLTFPTLQLGIEESLSKQFSIYTEGGYQLYQTEFHGGDTSFITNKGYKLSAEIRYYFLKRMKANLAAPYFAFNFFHRYNQYNETLDYYFKDDLRSYENLLTDNFSVKKSVTGFNFIFGYQFNFRSKKPEYEIVKKSPRTFMDIYVGVGSGNRITKNEHRDFDSTFHERNTPNDITVRGSLLESGLRENNGTMTNVVLGLRLGYRL